jgi:hypothetical protein
MQGFSDRLAMQHFAKTALMQMSWMQFGDDDDGQKRPPTLIRHEHNKDSNNNTPASSSNTHDYNNMPIVFYGISQGGILGGGYTAAAAAAGFAPEEAARSEKEPNNPHPRSTGTHILDKSVLGVPGTPFSLILSRSSDFIVYDKLMLLNFYNNRHVRIYLSMLQMAFDSISAAAHLAPTSSTSVTGTDNETIMVNGDDSDRSYYHHRPLPPVLMQAALGDAEVTSIAAEILARAYSVPILTSNPRSPIFGLRTMDAAKEQDQATLQHHGVLSEIMYQKDFSELSDWNEPSPHHNGAHLCLRKEPNFQEQVTAFIDTGRIIDPCINGPCVRKKARCD